MFTKSRAVATAVAMSAALTAASFVFAFVSTTSAVMARSPAVLGCGLLAAELAEPVCAQDQPFDRGAQVDVRQRGDDRLDAVQRSRGHPAARRIVSAGQSSAVLAQPDGHHAGHRERRRDDTGDLVCPALGAERFEGHLDLADGLGVEEGIRDDRRPAVIVDPLTTGTISTASTLRFGQRRADGDGGGLITGICWAHER